MRPSTQYHCYSLRASRTKSARLHFNGTFINIKELICMYANVAVFNPKVRNNLDSDNNSVQSEARGAAPCDAYLSRNCHAKDGFCSLQGECIWLSNFHSNISQMELILWNRKLSDCIWHWQMDGQSGKVGNFFLGEFKERLAAISDSSSFSVHQQESISR